MKMLSVRLDDAGHATLKARANEAGQTVSVFVKDWIDSLGGGEAVPPPAPGSEIVSPPPPVPIDPDDTVMGLSLKSSVADLRAAGHLPFLAAPVDDCLVCGHDRQASSHLGGQKCQFKTSPRRICGCTFEGF